ncbi:MAG: peptidoglycan-binding domain-containing protein [Tateyamaria sp.]|uniref:peptidoglycan-binding domain-containing protein n=1 Tax=Tateyamaria sp. TaxID=1929288 RepID=UPI00326EBA7C
MAQSDRVVALVVAGDDGENRADAFQAQLQTIGAETLRAQSANSTELRSLLKRFAGEAADSRAALVYIDLPIVTFEGRAFVLPSGSELNKATDLFTRSIPLQAFARSSVQAAQGGSVVATVAATQDDLPTDLSLATAAPQPATGSSPILLAAPDAFGPILDILATAAPLDTVELGALLNAMARVEGATLSDVQPRPVFLKQPAVAEEDVEVAAVTPVLKEPASPTDEAETREELEALEQSLSRSAKRSVQRNLRTRGFYRGLVDGSFGPQTRAAISAYQNSRSEEQTGILTRRQLTDLST